MTTRRLRHIFPLKLFPPKSTKDKLQLARCAVFATKPTLSSLHLSPVSSAEEAPLMPTICGSRSHARWGARSATNSRYLCAGPITVTTTAQETKSPGGGGGLLTPSQRRGCSGFRRGVSNKTTRRFAALRDKPL